MRFIIILGTVSLIIGVIIASFFVIEQVDRNTVYVSNPSILVSPLNHPPATPEHPAMADIRAMKEMVARINTMECNIKVTVQAQIAISLRGFIAMEKPKRFRFLINRRWSGSNEFDMGSNDEEFWFWSRRMKPSALYWATHENAHNTRLKTAFNPIWMMESMTGVLDTENVEIEKYKEFWKITKKDIGAREQKVLRITLLDPKKKVVVASYVVDEMTGKPISTSEVIDWRQSDEFGYIAKTLKIIWHNENIALRLELQEPKINQPVESKHWLMPNRTPKVDIAIKEVDIAKKLSKSSAK